jgi:hypothetical protein
MRRLDPVRRIFTLDLRSLALFRIGLALLSLYDLARRWPWITAFLSDGGFFSRQDYLAVINRPWSLSLHLMLGEPIQLQLVFVFHAFCAIGLLLGWKTRTLTVILWVLTGSLINRNPLAINGGDTFFSLLYFWGMFLPLGARWSVDAWRAARHGRAPAPAGWMDWASVGLILQIVALYWSTVALKSDPVWWSGAAIGEAFKLDLMTKPLALTLSAYPGLLAGLTWTTLFIEWLGPGLLLWPRAQAWLRPLVILAFIGLHLGIEWTLEVELFAWACIVAWLALLPASVWELGPVQAVGGIVRRALPSPMRPGPATLPAPTLAQGPFARLVCVLSLAFILLWVSKSVLPEELEEQLTHDLQPAGRLLRLRQSWSMFAPRPPSTDGWYVFRARQANGGEIDLLAGAQPLTWEKPACASCAYDGRRWTKYLTAIGKGRYRALRRPFGDFLIAEWNERHDVGFQIVEAELYYLKEYSARPEAEPERLRLWFRRNIEPTLR